jgi:transcriptional regulator with XRE-family HTH domain
MSTGKLNERLRYEREIRGWSQKRVADQLGTSEDTVSRWERGERKPDAYYREKLCLLFGKNAEELGLIDSIGSKTEESTSERLQSPERLPVIVSDVQRADLVVPAPSQAIDLVSQATDRPSEEQSGAWLALGASDLAALLGEGWSVEEVLESLRVVLQGVHEMSKMTRRMVLQLGAAAVVGGISIPTGRHISAENRVQLHNALGESIAAGWKLFHTSGNAQVLAVGQAQLYLVQQASSYLFSSVRPIYYSGVYNLIGAALHFQGHYDQAYQAHERAYVAALEAADVWNMAQSRSWQANGLREQKQHLEAIQTIEAALRLISQKSDTESIRLQAHLLASSAENAAFLGETEFVHKQLAASEALLEQLPPTSTEEFDHASWHQYAGTCALILEHHETAIRELKLAVETLPPQWIVRHATALMPLAIAYARGRERERCFETVKKAAQVVDVMNALSLNRQFAEYLEQEILASFPGDRQIRTFVTDARRRLVAADVR